MKILHNCSPQTLRMECEFLKRQIDFIWRKHAPLKPRRQSLIKRSKSFDNLKEMEPTERYVNLLDHN